MNIIMLAYSGSDYQKSLTQASIESLRRSASSGNLQLDDMKITIVESGPEIYNYSKVDHIVKYPETDGFNYNKALNEGVKEALRRFGRSEWWCFTNNDVIFGENWLVEICKAIAINSQLGAVSPNERYPKVGIDIGYTLGKNFAGCCFLLKDSVLAGLFPFDERFFFYFQDEDILEQLKSAGVQSGRVLSSRIFHIGGQTGKPNTELLYACRDQFIQKHSGKTYIENEMAKRAFWKECGEI